MGGPDFERHGAHPYCDDCLNMLCMLSTVFARRFLTRFQGDTARQTVGSCVHGSTVESIADARRFMG